MNKARLKENKRVGLIVNFGFKIGWLCQVNRPFKIGWLLLGRLGFNQSEACNCNFDDY